MKDDEYIPQMLVILSDAQLCGLISIPEEKRFADNLIDNKTADIAAAKCIEKTWEMKDNREIGLDYYKS